MVLSSILKTSIFSRFNQIIMTNLMNSKKVRSTDVSTPFWIRVIAQEFWSLVMWNWVEKYLDDGEDPYFHDLDEKVDWIGLMKDHEERRMEKMMKFFAYHPSEENKIKVIREVARQVVLSHRKEIEKVFEVQDHETDVIGSAIDRQRKKVVLIRQKIKMTKYKLVYESPGSEEIKRYAKELKRLAKELERAEYFGD